MARFPRRSGVPSQAKNGYDPLPFRVRVTHYRGGNRSARETRRSVMTQESKNEDVLFFNTRRTGKQPDRLCSITIKGTAYELASWNRESKTGKVFTSLVAKPKAAQAAE